MWAVSILCVLVSFFFMTLDMFFAKNSIFDASGFLASLPWTGYLGRVWPFLVIVVFNFWFFFRGEKWKSYLEFYDGIDEKVRRLGYLLAFLFIGSLLIFHIFQILTFT